MRLDLEDARSGRRRARPSSAGRPRARPRPRSRARAARRRRRWSRCSRTWLSFATSTRCGFGSTLPSVTATRDLHRLLGFGRRARRRPSHAAVADGLDVVAGVVVARTRSHRSGEHEDETGQQAGDAADHGRQDRMRSLSGPGRACHDAWHGRPAEPARRVVPLLRGAHHADARRRRGRLQGAGRRLRPRAAGRADLAAHRLRAALPPAGALGARAAGQPGLGRRRGLRRHLPRAPVRAAAPGHRRAAGRARRAGAEPPAGPHPPAVGDVPRRGTVRRPVRGHHQDPPRDGRRHRRGRHRPGHPRHHPGRAGDPPADTWRPAPEPSWVELVAGAVAETVRRPTAAVDAVRGGHRRGAARPPGRLARRPPAACSPPRTPRPGPHRTARSTP